MARGAVRSSSRLALMAVFASSAAAIPVATSTASRAGTTVLRTIVQGLHTSVIHDQRVQRVVLELLASLEKRELDHERHADHLAPELLDEAQGGRHGTAGREEIVDREHALARSDRILVDGQRVASVLELVLDLDRLAGELAELANGHEACAQLVRHRAREDEPARLDA